MAVSDDFNRANNANLGANWTDLYPINPPTILGNAVQATVIGAYQGSYYNVVAFNATQTSQVLVVVVNYCAPIVRASTGPNWYGYFNDGNLSKCVSGTVTSIGSPSLFGVGDTARIEASGTSITPVKNGTPGTPVTDSSLSSGSPGLILHGDVSSVDDWVGTGEGGGGSTATPSIGALVLAGTSNRLGFTINMPAEA